MRRPGARGPDRGAAGDAGSASSRRIAGNVGLVLIGRVLGIAVGLITLPLLVRSLGSEDFGVWTAALAYVGLFGALTEFGLTNASMLKMAADPEHEGEWLAALAALRTVLATVVTLVAVALIPFVLDADNDARLVGLVFCATILVQSAGAMMGVFQARLRSGVPLVITFLQSGLWITTVVTLAVLDASTVGFAIGYVGMLTVIAALQLGVTRGMAVGTWREARVRSAALLRIAVPLGLGGVFVTVYYKVDAILLYTIAGEREAGFYGAAYRLLDPLTFLPAALMASVFPVVSAAWGKDDERVRRIVGRCVGYMAMLGLPVLAGAIVLAEPVIELLYAEGFERSATVLPILGIAFVSICFGNLAGYLAPVVGITWRITIYAGIGAVVNVVLNLLLIPDYGAVGSAWATAVTEVLTMGLLLVTVLRAMGLRPELRGAAGALAAALVMAGVMLALRPIGLAPALLGALSYPAALFALRAVTVAEIKALRAG